MKIRMANEKDYDAIYELVKTAFQTAKVSDGTEQDFVIKLRQSKNYLPKLELVAEEDGKLVGHIMFTKQEVQTTTGIFEGLLVAPLCVAIEYRKQKIGGKLMQHGFEVAKQLGYTASFLIGDPEYYQRLGYKSVTEFNIENKSHIPDKNVLACEIVSGALEHIQGSILIEE